MIGIKTYMQFSQDLLLDQPPYWRPIKLLCFRCIMYLCVFSQQIKHNWNRAEADISQPVSLPLQLLESYLPFLQASECFNLLALEFDI
jgi:hypothetical protein